MSSPESGFPRREFLKKAGKIAAAVAAAGAAGLILGNEVKKGKDGIVRVNEGNFIPLYEVHTVGISPENFPQDIDALFRENANSLSYINGIFTDRPEYVKSLLDYKHEQTKTDADEIMLNLSRRNAPLVFGDPTGNRYSLIAVPVAEILAGGLAARAIIKSSIDKMSDDPTRRKLLQLALGAVALFGLSNLTDILGSLYKSNIPNRLKRVNRIGGIISHIHPEQPELFLRNAVMADKLLLTGRYLKEKLGRQPNIAFWVGAGHSGIEDFLQAGQEVCRKAIALYPKVYLRHVVDNTGGDEDFSSALLAYPHATGENQYTYDLVKITDQKLLERLLP